MNDPGLSSSINKILHPVNLRTTRASSNETAGKWTKSWYRLPFCQTLSLKPPNYISNHGFRSSEWWDIMRCPMVSMEEIARLRNAHMLPTTMNQRSPHVATHFCSHLPVFDSVLGNSISRPRRSKTLCPGGREATLRFLSQALCCVCLRGFSFQNSEANFRVFLLSCVYRNCINMAKLSSNKKMLIQVWKLHPTSFPTTSQLQVWQELPFPSHKKRSNSASALTIFFLEFGWHVLSEFG